MNISDSNILVIDNDEDVLLAARMLLKQHYNNVHTEKTPENIPTLLNSDNFDVILLDMNFTKDVYSGQEGFDWLKNILEIDPQAVVIFITAYGDVEKSVRAIKNGATDFILKPWQNEKLLTTVSTAVKLRNSLRETDRLRRQQKQINADIDKKYHSIIGESLSMQEVFNTIDKVAATEANVLILGDNGTGKELIARALHRQSGRADKVFISVDLGAISETLFESELFGHVKGAFTDAKKDRAGRFELASGGTLFLDEIGNIPLNLQAKLLSVLQNRQITPVGSNKLIDIDIRLICATNRPIYQLTQEKKFREDLLYRINTVEISLPALRERRDDIPLLANYFLNIYCKKYNKIIEKITKSAVNKLVNYSWPGNVRELQHVIERLVIMNDSTLIDSKNIILQANDNSEESFSQNHNLEKVEELIIRKILKKHKGNISKAASELGLTRASLYRRLDKYDL